MNTLPLSPAAWPQIAAEVARLPSCSYPEATYRPLREAIGRFAGFDWTQVVPGAGCDEVLLMCGALAMGRGDHAIVCRPTYQMYAVSSATAGARLEALAPRADLTLDYEALLERAPGARLVWVCSPNNPTGEEIGRDVVAELCASCQGLVVIDQAYLEFGGDDLSDLIATHGNLVICRTLSKAWALASLRVGYALASPPIAGALDALRPPGSISLQSAVAAELALPHAAEMRADAEAYVAERGRLRRGLEALAIDVLAEAGPFVTFRLPLDSGEAFRLLGERGLRDAHVRPRAAAGGRDPGDRPDPAGERPPAGGAGRDPGAGDAARGAGARRARPPLGAARDGRPRHEGDRDRRPAGGRRQRPHRDLDRDRLPGPHAARARVPRLLRPRPRDRRRPPGRRAPHHRGRRHRARPGARPRARRPLWDPPLRQRRRAPRRGRGDRRRRPRRARRVRDRPAAVRAAGGAGSPPACGRTCSTPSRAPAASTSTSRRAARTTTTSSRRR